MFEFVVVWPYSRRTHVLGGWGGENQGIEAWLSRSRWLSAAEHGRRDLHGGEHAKRQEETGRPLPTIASGLCCSGAAQQCVPRFTVLRQPSNRSLFLFLCSQSEPKGMGPVQRQFRSPSSNHALTEMFKRRPEAGTKLARTQLPHPAHRGRGLRPPSRACRRETWTGRRRRSCTAAAGRRPPPPTPSPHPPAGQSCPR
jgi:hypothetical protein